MRVRRNAAVDYSKIGDVELASLYAARDRPAIEHVSTTNNQRLFRAAWSILKNRSEAEDAVQAAYLSGLANIGTFGGRSALSTWLTRIVVNEALGRRRAERRRRDLRIEVGPANDCADGANLDRIRDHPRFQ
jgi:RNA polymerase sigma-70 factor, ECF subfamily